MTPAAKPTGILSGVGFDSAKVLAASLDRLTTIIERLAGRGLVITIQDFSVKRVALSDGAASIDGVNGRVEILPLK